MLKKIVLIVIIILLLITSIILILYNMGIFNLTNKSIQNIGQSDDALDSSTYESSSSFVEVTLYFADENTKKLKKENRLVYLDTYREKPIQTIFEQLKQGSITPNPFATIPNYSKLLNVELTDRTAIINLSNEFFDDISKDAVENNLIIYSIVNSITENKDIDKVLFEKNGSTIENFELFPEINKPIERNNEVVFI